MKVYYIEETECGNCGETLIIEHEKEDDRKDVWIMGTTRVEFYQDHVRIPLSDWNEIKQRLIPVLKQGDMKNGSTETGS